MVRSMILVMVSILAMGGISSQIQAQSLDELHKAAVKEGGTLNFYGTLAQINAEIVFPLFEKRFPASRSTISMPLPTSWWPGP